MNEDTYPPPVNKLLTYGASKAQLWQNWPNYAELGLGPEHIPDLIRMATDNELLWADSESLEVWAPIHAWRALGQLRAEAAIEPLLTLFEVPDEEDNEWAMDELQGYINTWSALQKFITVNHFNPGDDLMRKVKSVTNNQTMKIVFPVHLRMGQIEK